MIRTTKQEGDRMVLTERSWPLKLLGIIMVYVTIDELLEASSHSVADAQSHAHHAANVGGDSASGAASGSIAIAFMVSPLYRRLCVQPVDKIVKVTQRYLFSTDEHDVPIDDVSHIALAVSGTHAYAMLVRKSGERLRFSTAFRLLFMLGGVPKRLEKHVQPLAERLGVKVINEHDQMHGTGWMSRYLGGD